MSLEMSVSSGMYILSSHLLPCNPVMSSKADACRHGDPFPKFYVVEIYRQRGTPVFPHRYWLFSASGPEWTPAHMYAWSMSWVQSRERVLSTSMNFRKINSLTVAVKINGTTAAAWLALPAKLTYASRASCCSLICPWRFCSWMFAGCEAIDIRQEVVKVSIVGPWPIIEDQSQCLMPPYRHSAMKEVAYYWLSWWYCTGFNYPVHFPL